MAILFQLETSWNMSIWRACPVIWCKVSEKYHLMTCTLQIYTIYYYCVFQVQYYRLTKVYINYSVVYTKVLYVLCDRYDVWLQICESVQSYYYGILYMFYCKEIFCVHSLVLWHIQRFFAHEVSSIPKLLLQYCFAFLSFIFYHYGSSLKLNITS